jgi:hypothetical protein
MRSAFMREASVVVALLALSASWSARAEPPSSPASSRSAVSIDGKPFTISEHPAVPPAPDAMTGGMMPASPVPRTWLTVDGDAGNVHFSDSGIPVVPSPASSAKSAPAVAPAQAITLDGRIVAAPLVSASAGGTTNGAANPATVDFGNVPINTTVSRSVTITVDANYTVSLASGSGINVPFAFAFGTCNAGGGFTGPGTCAVTESFSPKSTGAATGTTNVFECPVAGGSCIAIPFNVQGSGISVAAANPGILSFGNVPINTTVSQSATITVDTGYQVSIASGSGINVPFSFSFGTCNAFTGPGTCVVTESFKPTAVTASAGTTNVYECPVAGGACIGIPIIDLGTGISNAVANPQTVVFGNVQIGTSASRNVTITADTGYQVSIASGSGINAPFSFAFGTCNAGGGFTGPGTCAVVESFHPTASGPFVAITNVFECPVVGGSCIAIPFNVQGVGVVVGPPIFQGAASRKVHGAVGTFDLPLSLVPTDPTTEPRQGPAQTVVLTFNKPANGATVTVTEGTATASAPTFSGNDVIVALSGVSNAQYVTVTLTNITSSDGGTGGSASVRIGYLACDVNQNRVVTGADLGLVNAQLAQPVTAANYLKDVNASGALTVADKAITNTNLTRSLPAP